MAAASLSALSASVTRILSLTGFPKELKTKDIQSVFSEWESANGGFKIKWIDDTSLYIVFQDPTVAKRAYLKTIAFPPAIFTAPGTSQQAATLRPYDGPDAQTVIHAVNTRHASNTASRSARSASMSVSANPLLAHGRGPSLSIPRSALNGGPESALSPLGAGQREPSPTLPNLPAQPTLNALIEHSLAGAGAGVGHGAAELALGADPAVLAAGFGPRIGDPGKRMLGHALGVRHPGLAQRNGDMNGLQKAMNGLAVAEAA